MTAKEEFIEIYNQYINRKGADELLEWIERTDFFTAPASTRYHCSWLMFSTNVRRSVGSI